VNFIQDTTLTQGIADRFRIELHDCSVKQLDTTRELASCADFSVRITICIDFKHLADYLFQIAENLADLIAVDYRLRAQVIDCLQKNYLRNQNRPVAQHIAFQIAFCYRIGFGVRSDMGKCHLWLHKSSKHTKDLTIAIKSVQPAIWKNRRKHELNVLVQVDLIHEYTAWGLKTLKKALEEYEREVTDMKREFGKLHFLTLGLYTVIGNLLDALGEFMESKTLRMRIRDKIQKTDGVGSPYYIQSIINVSQSLTNLGEWKEEQRLLEELLKFAAIPGNDKSLGETKTAR